MAEIHARAVRGARAWSAAQCAASLGDPAVFLAEDGVSFALGRAAAGEAELLLLATDPAHQREGRGRDRLREYESLARARGAAQSFLEVAADNAPARALYAAAGYRVVGKRPDYYARPGDGRTAALVMAKDLGDP
ncbi:GNAT family N-acetyltransferase [Aquicoccus sp. SCR17]|nr:GNAT family N-acetyltransferase [Carideicomes alvinocaridis]